MRRMYSYQQIQEITRELLNSENEVIKGKWEEEVNIELRSEWLNGLTNVKSYSKLCVKNGIAYIVISAYLRNNTESTITTSGNQNVFNISELSDEISSKIYRKDGTNLTQNPTTGNNILVKQGYRSSTTGGDVLAIPITINSDTPNSFFGYPRDTISCSPNSNVFFDFRVFITL